MLAAKSSATESESIPCPFCSECRGLVVVCAYPDDEGYFVLCKCGANGPLGKTEEEAIELWNRRQQ